MTDIVSPEKRSKMMSGIRSKNTIIEVAIRKALFARKFRYRINDKRLPGKPDIVLPSYRAVILIHGCFWHGHDCHIFRMPKSNTKFWHEKIQANQKRDKTVTIKLAELGWRIAIVSECAIRGSESPGLEYVASQLDNWLKSTSQKIEISGLL